MGNCVESAKNVENRVCDKVWEGFYPSVHPSFSSGRARSITDKVGREYIYSFPVQATVRNSVNNRQYREGSPFIKLPTRNSR